MGLFEESVSLISGIFYTRKLNKTIKKINDICLFYLSDNLIINVVSSITDDHMTLELGLLWSP